ncbi:MAG: DNA repair protein RecN [Gammaproteobacteria bacterium]|nr:DNA repair protein RecN [Gammaproteobacteria bacterium]
MLEHLTIKDFIIVESLELDVDPGLTVLTGETGAGKSVLLDALGFVLGDRADSGAIRQGCERADITTRFLIEKLPAAKTWLHERELESESDCVLRRTLSQDGRSRAYINGNTVPVQSLRELGELLVDIHGQNVHQSLLKSVVQRDTVDEYAGHSALLSKVASTHARWRQLETEYQTLHTALSERDARLELLRYQVLELQTLDLRAGELDELDQEHARLANASRLLQGSEHAVQMLYENEETSLCTSIDKLIVEIEQLAHYDADLKPAAELLSNASIQLHEAAHALRSYRDRVDLDPQRLQSVEERMAAIHDAARKHRITTAELPAFTARLTDELQTLEHADARLDELKRALDSIAQDYRSAATGLSHSRKKAAHKLAQAVTQQMQDLGMRGGVFEIAVTALEEAQFGAHGMDRIEFLVSTNPGQPARALNKVASGGELSRISLSIEVATAQITGIPTLVFDEVDAGVGGGVAEIVGRRLSALAQHRQILCVTHLPQVAAQGQHHWTVQKQARKGQTRTDIAVLDSEARIDEVARMLGGMKVTPQTLAHAKEMLLHAQQNSS